MKRILSLLLCAAMLVSMVVVANADDTVTLRMATGYNSAKTGIVFDSETAGEGVTLADGNTYKAGELKPTWKALEGILGVAFESKYQGNNSTKEFEFWKDRLAEVDMVSGPATTLNEYGETGSLINLAEHMDKLPNFKAYLDANPIVRLSIMGNTTTGAIYFSPYFDGVDDIERMPLMRVDYAVKLLDGEGEFTAEACNDIAAPVYTPYMPTEGKVEIETPNLEGKAIDVVVKDYDAYGNIVAKMNEKGVMSGVEAVNMLREYIDKTYNGYYGTTRSNLFVGQNAAWDVDELVALLRCVVANPQSLNGKDSIQGMYSREDNNNQRRVDLFRFAGSLFGVRGMESRQDYLYFGTDGALKDARQETATYEALAKMHDIAAEGLISKAYIDAANENSSTYLENDNGFVSYDYNQTQTVMNATKLQEGEKYMAIMVPVAKWFDGTEGGKFMRFTESWRSVKTDAWAISKAGVEANPGALDKALALIDYAYSPEGQILMSYGPAAFIKEGETFIFNGKEMPVIADATYAELWDKAKGNYTNYARQYLGSTLSFVKSQAFEYQCTHEVGKEGAGYISTAIGLGTIKHPLLEVAENPWYTSIPTVLPNSKPETDMINSYAELSANGKFSSGKGGENLFVDIIVKGAEKSAEEQAAEVTGAWHGKQYLALRQSAWKKLVSYYESVK
jgi:putative aldouronate transport system substrate-binding protein